MPVAPNLFETVDAYIDGLFAAEDEALTAALAKARAAGLPQIQVSPGQGKLIYLLAKLVGARRILEIGALAGYSTIWLARALPVGGRLVTLEAEPKHADIAIANIAHAGLSDRVSVVVGPARDTLPGVMAAEAEPFDLVFIDADKVSYPVYLDLVMQKVRSGSLILADNVVRAGAVLAPQPHDPSAAAVRAFNQWIADDPRLEAIVLQQVGVKGHDGLAIARVR
jgi:predicted O-methyltransferase YrrM